MYALAEALTIPLPYAIGIMQLLWEHAGQHTPRGDIGSLPDDSIKQACCFARKAHILIDALVESRWIDRHDEYRLVIHDWPDHCEQSVKKWLEYNGKTFLPIYGNSREILRRKAGDSPPSREVKAKAAAVGSFSGGSAEGGDMRAEWDDQWQDFRGKYLANLDYRVIKV
jgi:hypothetical protein